MSQERLENKLDKLSDDVKDLSVHVAGYNVLLQEHMRRTALLEDSTKPVIDDHKIFRGILKWVGGGLGFVGGVAALVLAIDKIISLF